MLLQQMKQKYKNNPYVLQKLHQYIEHIPDYLKNVELEYTKRTAKKDEQQKQTSLFVKSDVIDMLYATFLNKQAF